MWISVIIACAAGNCHQFTGSQFFETQTACLIVASIDSTKLLKIGNKTTREYAKKKNLSEEDTNKLLKSLSLKYRCDQS